MNSEVQQWIERTPRRWARNGALVSLAWEVPYVIAAVTGLFGDADVFGHWLGLALVTTLFLAGLQALIGFLAGLAARRRLRALLRKGDESFVQGVAGLPGRYAAVSALVSAFFAVLSFLWHWNEILEDGLEYRVGALVIGVLIWAPAGTLVGLVLRSKLRARMAATPQSDIGRAAGDAAAAGPLMPAEHALVTPAPSGGTWFAFADEQQLGPMDFEALAKLAAEQKVGKSDLVWTAGYDKWVSAGSVAALFPSSTAEQAGKAPTISIAPEDRRAATGANTTWQSDHEMVASVGAIEEGSSKRGNYFVRHWRGELSLPVSYWINGAVGTVITSILLLIVTSSVNSEDDFHPSIAFATLLFVWLASFAFVTWQMVGIWGSATVYQRTNPAKFWGGIAKVAVVVGALRVLAEFGTSGGPQILEMYKIYAGDDERGKHAFRVLRDGQELEFSGPVRFGAAKEFESFLNALGALKVVHLDSQGGRILEAQKMADMIKQRGLNTYVANRCLSACTIMFLSGRERYISEVGKLGFHQPDFPGMSDEDRRDAIAKEERRLRDLGVSESFARRANAAAPSSMWYPSARELLAEKIVTRVVKEDDFAISGFGSRGTPDQVRDKLLSSDIYVAIRRVDPNAYARISQLVDEGVRKGISFAELQAQLSPIVIGVLSEIVPHVSEQNLLGHIRFFVKRANLLKREHPSFCYFYMHPDKAKPGAVVDILSKDKALMDEELSIKTKILKEFSGQRIPKPQERDIQASLEKVQQALIAQFGDNIVILAEADVKPHQHDMYCSVSVGLYEEVLKLPQRESVPLLRYLMAG